MKNYIFFALKVGFWSHYCASCLVHMGRAQWATMCLSKTRTSRNVLNDAGCTHRNRAPCINNLLDFPILIPGLIIMEMDQDDLVKIFFMTQRLFNSKLWCSIRMRIIIHCCTIFLSSCMAAKRPYTTQNMVQPVYYSPVHTHRSKTCIIL